MFEQILVYGPSIFHEEQAQYLFEQLLNIKTGVVERLTNNGLTLQT